MKKSTDELMKILKEKKTYEEFFTEEVEELCFCTVSDFLNMLITEKNLKKADITNRESELDGVMGGVPELTIFLKKIL